MKLYIAQISLSPVQYLETDLPRQWLNYCDGNKELV